MTDAKPQRPIGQEILSGRLAACEKCGAVFLWELHSTRDPCWACGGLILPTPFEVPIPETPADLADEGDELARECGEMLDTMDGQVRRVGP